MRIIICGGGQVGYSIASYLSNEDNDVTVIDINHEVVSRINNELEVHSIVGHASHPDVLEAAGARSADLIIAVTHQDEVNMVACQVAHSLFNVQKKIARIRRRSFLDPGWANLFSRDHMPIDVIISPEYEVANAISQRLAVPGTTNVLPLSDGKVYLVGVICDTYCPIVNTQLRQLPALFPNLSIEITYIVRQNRAFIPDKDDQMQIGDEVFFFVDAKQLQRAMDIFGNSQAEARRIVIMGGGNIGYALAEQIMEEHPDMRVKILESNLSRARQLSAEFENLIVIHGNGLDRDIMEEANISRTEVMVAVTDDDEANILGSLLAKQDGCKRVISLVNKNTYGSIINSLGIDAVVSPRSITVSSIMQHIRRGRIRSLYTLKDSIAEIIEAEVCDATDVTNKSLSELPIPQNVVIGAVVRGEDVFMPSPNFVLKSGDRVIMMVPQGLALKVEKLFSVNVELM